MSGQSTITSTHDFPPAPLFSGAGVTPLLRRYWPFLFLIVAAVILRSPVYGNPDVSLDEQFYLVVADRMLHGAIPYVDIWDRKPIGLFLIYAATRLLGGDGFVQYQIVASLFAGATAGVIWLMARRAANDAAGLVAGLAYIIWLNLFSGDGGQSPVFYNLFVATAAYIALLTSESSDPRRIIRSGAIAMALCGLTLQVKYTAIFESLFLGLWILRRLWITNAGPATLLLTAAFYAFLGIAPTLAVAGYYAAIGHLPEFAYANFWSIFDRGRLDASFLSRALDFFVVITLPLQTYLLFALVRWRDLYRNGQQQDFLFFFGWLVAAMTDFVMIGNFYDHYFLPVLAPAFICMAPLLVKPVTRIPLAAFLIGWAMWSAGYPNFPYHAERRDKVMALSQAVAPYVKKDCLYVFDGPAILYMTTHACAPTRFVYPDHLSNDVEKYSIGADTVAEMRRVLASRPGAIVTASSPVIPKMNPETLPLLRTALLRDYRPVAAINHPQRIFYVYARKDLAKTGGMRPFYPYFGR